MNLYLRPALFLLMALLLGCSKTKLNASEGRCQTTGMVVDYDGLDGCGYLIQLKDGKMLNPIEFPEGFRFKNNQPIHFDFRVLHDMGGACMVESEMVEITCIEDDRKENAPVECEKIINPFAIGWMDKAINRHNPVKIIKYQMGGKWTFAFQAVPTTFLYDCDGNLLCQTDGDEMDECHQKYLNSISKGKTIWQGEGVWD